MNNNLNKQLLPFGALEVKGNKATLSLKSVSLTGEMRGLFFKSAIKQIYENKTNKPLKIIFTFPIPCGICLSDISVAFKDKCYEGIVIDKFRNGEGTDAILLEKQDDGLYCANLGCIEPCGEVSIEIRCCFLLCFGKNQVMLSSINEKNADFVFQLRIFSDEPRSEITSQSHKIIKEDDRIFLAESDKLDRDFILLIKKETSLSMYARDGNETLVLASFAPELPDNDHTPVALKILLDCSGSMRGNMEAVKAGLKKIAELLQPQDYISFSCFGSEVWHWSQTMLSCSPENIRSFSVAINNVGADMGATEQPKAIESVLDIELQSSTVIQPVILLITDGDIWSPDKIAADAQKSGQRIYIINIGNKLSENAFQHIGYMTGGAYEFVTRQTDITRVVSQMLQNMRKAVASDVRIAWNNQTKWQSSPPAYLFSGETAHCFAVMSKTPEYYPYFCWQTTSGQEREQVEYMEICPDPDFCRLVRQYQIEDSKKIRHKLNLAVKYQIFIEQTNYVLLNIACKQKDAQISDKVGLLKFMNSLPGSQSIFAVQETANLLSLALDKTGPVSVQSGKFTIAAVDKIVTCWNENLYSSESLLDCLDPLQDDPEILAVEPIINQICTSLQISDEAVWAIIVCICLESPLGDGTVDRHSMRLIKFALSGIPKETINKIRALLCPALTTLWQNC